MVTLLLFRHHLPHHVVVVYIAAFVVVVVRGVFFRTPSAKPPGWRSAPRLPFSRPRPHVRRQAPSSVGQHPPPHEDGPAQCVPTSAPYNNARARCPASALPPMETSEVGAGDSAFADRLTAGVANALYTLGGVLLTLRTPNLPRAIRAAMESVLNAELKKRGLPKSR